MAGRQDHSVGGGGMDPEVALKDQVDLTHAGDKEAEKFKPREDDYDATSKHAAGSSGEKVPETKPTCLHATISMQLSSLHAAFLLIFAKQLRFHAYL